MNYLFPHGINDLDDIALVTLAIGGLVYLIMYAALYITVLIEKK